MLSKIINYFNTAKTPKFWLQDGIIPQILLPLSVLYFIIKRIIGEHKNPEDIGINVITVGNPIAGGSGKTPVAIALSQIIAKEFKSKKTCFVSKGYGGSLNSPTIIDLGEHSSDQTGDEARLLAKFLPTIVSKDRLQGVKVAKERGFDIVITDDGLHDNRFKKSVNFAVIDGAYGLGNRFVMPSGPLRDRIDIALKNSRHLIVVGEDKGKIVKYIKMRTRRSDFKVFNSSIKVISKHDEKRIYVAFTGIAYPQKFFSTLEEGRKYFLDEKIEFADHHKYSDEDIEYLKNVAEKCKGKLITTEKDFVKLTENFQKQVECVQIALQFDDHEALLKTLKQAIQ